MRDAAALDAAPLVVGGRDGVWSSRGHTLAYIRGDEYYHKTGEPPLEVWLMDPAAGTDVRLAPLDGYVLDFIRWSADDRYLAVAYYAAQGQGFYVVDVASGQVMATVRGAAIGGWIDGDTVYFTGNICNAPDVFVMDADGSHARNITQTPDVEFHPAASPDGRQIAIVHTNEPHAPSGDRIDILTPAGERRTLVSGDSLQLASYVGAQGYWSPDGRYLTVVRVDGYQHAVCQDVMPQTTVIEPAG